MVDCIVSFLNGDTLSLPQIPTIIHLRVALANHYGVLSPNILLICKDTWNPILTSRSIGDEDYDLFVLPPPQEVFCIIQQTEPGDENDWKYIIGLHAAAGDFDGIVRAQKLLEEKAERPEPRIFPELVTDLCFQLVKMPCHGEEQKTMLATALRTLLHPGCHRSLETKERVNFEIDVTARDNHGYTMMNYAAERDNCVVANILFDCGDATVNAESRGGWTPLLTAAHYGNYDVVTLILNRKGDVNKTNFGGRTALMFACESGYIDVVRTLLREKDVEVNRVNFNGWSSLVFACLCGFTEVVEELLTIPSIDVNLGTHLNRTPLVFASRNGHIDVVELLLGRKAELDAVGQDGRTAVSVAAENGNVRLVDMLVRAGADFHIRDSESRSPLAYAEARQHVEVARYLRLRGANIA